MNWKRILLFVLLLFLARVLVTNLPDLVVPDSLHLPALMAALALVFVALGYIQSEQPFAHAYLAGLGEWLVTLGLSVFARLLSEWLAVAEAVPRDALTRGLVVLAVSATLGTTVGTVLRSMSAGGSAQSRAPGVERSIPWTEQLSRLRPTLLVSVALALAGFFGIFALSLATEEPVRHLTRDPIVLITHERAYIGILSNVGNLLWAAATGICLFGAAVLSRDRRRRRDFWFLLWSGLLCLLLTLDDTLLFHELVIPIYLLIPERGVYLSYVALWASYMLYYRQRIFRTDYLLLLLALLFLTASAVTDVFSDHYEYDTEVGALFEDSLKFSGIVFWLAYFAHVALRLVREGPAGATGAESPSPPVAS